MSNETKQFAKCRRCQLPLRSYQEMADGLCEGPRKCFRHARVWIDARNPKMRGVSHIDFYRSAEWQGAVSEWLEWLKAEGKS